MIRPLEARDKKAYLALVDAFYHSEAVAHTIPPAYYENTFRELMRSDTYAQCFLLEHENQTAGYVLLAKTFSQEAGGLVWWIEELYLHPQFRGLGLGTEVFRFLERTRPEAVKRFRLEVEADNLRAKALYARLGFEPLPYEQRIREF